MSLYWQKLGNLFTPSSPALHPKLRSHAANPLPVHLAGNEYRVFYSGRDEANRSSVGAVDIDLAQRRVIAVHETPFFEHGPAGSFYEAGVSIGNCYAAGGTRYILFMGWQQPAGGHWRGDVGRLVLSADLTLTLDSPQAFMAADERDPVSLSYPWVIGNEQDGFRMWYGSTLTWDAGNGEMLHVLCAASSMNGHHWSKEGVAIPYALGVAQAFSRPTVLRSGDGGYEMWFSYRSGAGEKYRIGYAHSADGAAWHCDYEHAGITVSRDGWDSEMVEYPFVWAHEGETYMLYNGNGYGLTGFGLAVLERD